MIPIANPTINQNARERVEEVLDSGMLADGPEVRAFEREFATYCGTEHAIATSNGTTALHAALEGLGIGEGDTVLTTPFSFVATANAIRLTGAEPVFADIDPETYNLDPDTTREIACQRSIDAIIAVHLYGLPAEMDPLVALADDLDVPLIEDAAQAHGAEYKDERVGSIGDVGCFSFYPTKNMTTGEGGMIITDDNRIADNCAQFINHGRADTYEHETVGHNYRMTSIAAVIGRSQLKRLPDFIEARRSNATQLTEQIATIDDVMAPTEPEHMKHVYHQYTIRTEMRDTLLNVLEENGIGAAVYYPTCIHDQPAYDDINSTNPQAEMASKEVLSLPVHPSVSHTDIEHILEVISTYAC